MRRFIKHGELHIKLRNPISLPSQFCMACLDTSEDCKLYPATEKHLDWEYEQLLGISLQGEVYFVPHFCTECAQRLINCGKFRDKCNTAYTLLMDSIDTHALLKMEDIKTINRHKIQLASKLDQKVYPPNHFDFVFMDTKIEIENIRGNIQENIIKDEDTDVFKGDNCDTEVVKDFSSGNITLKDGIDTEYLNDRLSEKLNVALNTKENSDDDKDYNFHTQFENQEKNNQSNEEANCARKSVDSIICESLTKSKVTIDSDDVLTERIDIQSNDIMNDIDYDIDIDEDADYNECDLLIPVDNEDTCETVALIDEDNSDKSTRITTDNTTNCTIEIEDDDNDDTDHNKYDVTILNEEDKNDDNAQVIDDTDYDVDIDSDNTDYNDCDLMTVVDVDDDSECGVTLVGGKRKITNVNQNRIVKKVKKKKT